MGTRTPAHHMRTPPSPLGHTRRYFADWQATAGSAPDFVYPDSDAGAPACGSESAPRLAVDLSSRAAALQGMVESLREALPLPPAPHNQAEHLPPSQLSYNVAEAGGRQSAFFYQVSLPHYRDPTFIATAVSRCPPVPPYPPLHSCLS